MTVDVTWKNKCALVYIWMWLLLHTGGGYGSTRWHSETVLSRSVYSNAIHSQYRIGREYMYSSATAYSYASAAPLTLNVIPQWLECVSVVGSKHQDSLGRHSRPDLWPHHRPDPLDCGVFPTHSIRNGVPESRRSQYVD